MNVDPNFDPRGIDYMTFCKNEGSDTYSAVKAAIWLMHMSTGKIMSEADARQLVKDAKAKALEKASRA